MNEEFLSCLIHPRNIHWFCHTSGFRSVPAEELTVRLSAHLSSRKMHICHLEKTVTSEKTVQVSHAVFFPLPLKEDTELHPVNASNANRLENVVADNEETIL